MSSCAELCGAVVAFDGVRALDGVDLVIDGGRIPVLLGPAGLTGLERRLYGQLSGGEKQRVLFALALAGDPSLLFLDEPTVGMDVVPAARSGSGCARCARPVVPYC